MRRVVILIPESTRQPRGGIMNLVRHGRVARSLGAEVVIATESGRDRHGRTWFRHDLPCIRWDERRPGDACVVPDLYSDRADDVKGPCFVYLQTPLRVERNFDDGRGGVQVWTDSPFMLERCRAVFPGREIPIVPNVVDEEAFPFIPQARRRDGMIIFFPRKGEDFGRSVFDAYRAGGGRYWQPTTVDRMRFDRMARLFREPQAFFASAEIEGCALPPQESMAAGIVVVGRDAKGANFCMEHGETAMVANAAAEAVASLHALEEPALRERLAARAYERISRFFPRNEPSQFWRGVLESIGDARPNGAVPAGRAGARAPAAEPDEVDAGAGPSTSRRALFTGGSGTWGDLAFVAWQLAAGGWRGGGHDLESLHQAVRRCTGVPHVFTYGAARMGLYEALRAMGIGEGDEVVVPGFTCAVVVNAVRFTGATPVYADIELSRLGPDPEAVAAAITPRTAAIVIHHLFGIPCRVEELLAVARRHGLAVIEDSAMALGGRYRGRALGSFGDAAIFSMERTKVISTGHGGILVTAETALAATLERSHAQLPIPPEVAARRGLERYALDFLTGGPLCGRPSRRALRLYRRLRRRLGRSPRLACETFDRKALYEGEYAGRMAPGYPWRLPPGLARLASRQLRRLGSDVARRGTIARGYEEILRRQGASVPEIDRDTMEPSWLRYPFWVEDVGGWQERLRRAGVEAHEAGRWFGGPVHPATCLDDPSFGYVPGTCPRGEWLGRRILNLPTSPRLGRWLVERLDRL